jgi:protein O-mannosyl-transferase
MESSFRKYRLALSLGLAAFLLYLPSLGAGFVYDGVLEVREGFFTSLANLPDVLSLKVLGMDLMLRDRPGQILYLMLIAAVCGTKPFGYHLCSNLLHAANAALLSVLCAKLISVEAADEATRWPRRISWAVATGVLIFALHPLAVEPVAAINFSSDLLVGFFTLLAMLAATSFDPRRIRAAWLTGAIGVICVFFAVASKESGASACAILIVYWFLFRRRDPKVPWLCFLGSAVLVTAAFTIAQLQAAPSSASRPFGLYPIHSLQGFVSIQPRAWAFMALKIIWPTSLSVDYTLENVGWIPLAVALPLLIGIFSLQAWLSIKSRIGALGVAFCWLGLAPVSNFFPLTHFVADRYYYLPMLGVALQLVALFCMAARFGDKLRWVIAPFVIVLLPLALLSLSRETIFSNDLSLWTATVQVSPSSSIAHENLAADLMEKGSVEEAIDQLREALRINPSDGNTYNNLGVALMEKGSFEEAVIPLREALRINPTDEKARYNIGVALKRKSG